MEFTMRISGCEDLDSPIRKSSPITVGVGYTKSCLSVPVEDSVASSDMISSLIHSDASAVVLTMPTEDISSSPDTIAAVNKLRKLEKETRRSIFVILSLTHSSDFVGEQFINVCKMVYTSGIDGILLDSTRVDHEILKGIRKYALGLRGRRVRIFLDGVSSISESLEHADGVFLSHQCDDILTTELLRKQKLLFSSDVSLAISRKIDVLVSTFNESEAGTPATTISSSPDISPVRMRSYSASTSFLWNEVMRYVSRSTRLIIVLSDDGTTASELSAHSRIVGEDRLPLILALSASESTCRFAGCLYGVRPLQAQSFVSIDSVITNAVEYAKDNNLLHNRDEVVIVTQPPPVTASTNQTCFEGVVHSRFA